MSKSEKCEILYVSITTVIMTVMNISGLPATLFVNIKILDIQPFYFSLMVNFVLTAVVFFVAWKTMYPDWNFGLGTKGVLVGLKKYGISGVIIFLLSSLAFIVGLYPFNNSPSIAKLVIEGFVYYIGVAFIEELYIRGLLQNIIEKLLHKKQNASFYAIIFASVIFGLGHIFGALGSSTLTIICKVVWTIALGLYLGAIYKKAGNLWVPIILHTIIDFCAWPFCYSTISPYPQISLLILLVIYMGVGVYAFRIMKSQ